MSFLKLHSAAGCRVTRSSPNTRRHGLRVYASPSASPEGGSPRKQTQKHAQFKIVWPTDFKKRLEQNTLDRAHQADVTPTVFDFGLWRKHRSYLRFAEHMTTMWSSDFLQDLSGTLVAIMSLAAAIGAYETGLEMHLLPAQLPNIAVAAPEPFNLTSFALSLLLVFRTNSCYSRWLEARKLWGSLVNRSRNLARQALMLVPPSQVVLRAAICRWTVAFAKTLKVHLREGGDPEKVLRGVLAPHELEVVVRCSNRPLAVLQGLSQLMVAAGLDPISQSRLDANLEVMEDIMGSCERILKTPLPLSYTRHTARFLVLWLTFLPFSLWEKVHWNVVPASGLIGYLLLGVDQIAIHLEEPFGLLPLEVYCETIQRNVQELQACEGLVQTAVDASLLRPSPGVSVRASRDVPPHWNGAEVQLPLALGLDVAQPDYQAARGGSASGNGSSAGHRGQRRAGAGSGRAGGHASNGSMHAAARGSNDPHGGDGDGSVLHGAKEPLSWHLHSVDSNDYGHGWTWNTLALSEAERSIDNA